MEKPTLRQIVRYKVDNFMAKGGKSIFTSLFVMFVLSLVLIMALRAVIMAFGLDAQHEGGWLRHLYITFLEMTDPGNMAQDITSSPFYKIPAILSGIAGIILLSMLIGFITTALVQQLENLRKGHSKVIEEGHSLILGWSDQRVIEILRELIMANESEDDPAVVILADKPKEEMDDYLNLALPDSQRLNTRIVTRSGSTSSLINLQVAAVDTCRSAIVLASASEDCTEEDKAISDARTIKTILALTNARGPEEDLNIVAEIFDQVHHDIVQDSCTHPITVVEANDVLAKIIVQTSRSVGLSVVYNEILSFDGCEMYFHGADWKGRNFGTIQFHFPDGVPMGIRKPSGEILINPSIDTVMEEGDEVLIVADDDSTIEYQDKPVAKPRDLPLNDVRLDQHVESELIIGWNRKGRIIINEYADYVLPGSTIDVVVKNPAPEVVEEIEALDRELPDIIITLHDRDPLKVENLSDLNPGMRDNIILLSDQSPERNAEEVDAQTILILLMLRKVFDAGEMGPTPPRLITEVMDSRNQGLISRAGVKDFIVSNRFVSMMLAQISEQPAIKEVYDSLFSEDGSEIYLKPASTYFETLPMEVTFADCMAIAQKRGEVCIGLKIKALESEADKNFGVDLIPEKNTRFTLTAQDCLVVVSEDET